MILTWHEITHKSTALQTNISKKMYETAVVMYFVPKME